MDIDLLSKLVKELIMDHDEVALPGVGTFVAELVPSSFSDRGYTINPPYRRLYFRQRVNDDNLLAGFYLKVNNLSADSAEGKVAEQGLVDFLGEMRVMLLEKKTIVFPGLGRLRSTRENNFFFIPDEDLDIYPSGFGLEPISLKTHEETPDEVSAAVAGLASIIDETPAGETPVAETEPETPVEIVLPETEVVAAEPAKKSGKTWIWIIVGILAAAAIFLLALMILGRVAPDLVDKFLYSEDELRIINY